MLSRKDALLDATMSEGVGGMKALARVLGTRADNIMAVLDQKEEMSERASKFTPLQRQKRQGSIIAYTTILVQFWWHENTRVSSNMKDVINKDGGEKMGGLTHVNII